MTELVSYQLHDSIATVTLDDGKVNVLSHQMLRDIDGALDHAATKLRAREMTLAAIQAGIDLDYADHAAYTTA